MKQGSLKVSSIQRSDEFLTFEEKKLVDLIANIITQKVINDAFEKKNSDQISSHQCR